MGAGVLSLPNASQKICITRGESRDRVFAAASDFLLHRARSPRTPLISSWNRRILFFTGQRALFQDGTSFSLLFPFYFLSGTRPAGVLRRPGHRKNYQSIGPLPGFLWRTAPTTEEPQRERIPALLGKYATTPAPSVPREGGRGQKWAQEPIPAAWCERKLYITAFAVRIGAAFCFRTASDKTGNENL